MYLDGRDQDEVRGNNVKRVPSMIYFFDSDAQGSRRHVRKAVWKGWFQLLANLHCDAVGSNERNGMGRTSIIQGHPSNMQVGSGARAIVHVRISQG